MAGMKIRIKRGGMIVMNDYTKLPREFNSEGEAKKWASLSNYDRWVLERTKDGKKDL